MATLADLNADLLAMVTTPLNSTGITWSVEADALTLDHRVPSDQVTLQIGSAIIAIDGDSNDSNLRAQAAITLNYNMDDVDANQTNWLEVELQIIMAVLVTKSTWRNLASVYEVQGTPEASFPTKVGDIVSVTVSSIVSLV